MSIRFDGKVAIVTGAANGLGRAHALGLAERGAKVVIVDFGGARDGSGGGTEAGEKVVSEITKAGGEAIAFNVNVTDRAKVDAMVADVVKKWGRVDILINNAGILRDKTFAKMDLADFELVVDVHLIGTVNCTKAVWEHMKNQSYGRIVLTSSSSGLYGNFGQANYGAAKMAMVGFMNVLHIEGGKNNIRVNTLAPAAATRMTEELMPKEMADLLKPELITPGVLYLVSEDAPSRVIMGAGAGAFARTVVLETEGIYVADKDLTPEAVAERFAEIDNRTGARELMGAQEQTAKYVQKAAAAKGITLPPRR